ncbi:molybdopterin-binding protein, partial [Turicibacter sanguinis]|nr:molybdopterin-binding protein [Turicibacter sanguinis]
MKMIKVEDAIGSILTHDVTQIIPGQFKGRLFKKGHLIQEEDIEKLRAIGKEHIYVWEVKEGQLHENDAAIRLSNLAKGDGIRASDEIKEGKIDFFADCDGVLKIDKEKLMTLNSIGEMMMATIHTNTPLKKGEKIGGTRVIPLVIDEEKIKEAETLITDKIMWMEPFKAKKCLLITTGNEVYKG